MITHLYKNVSPEHLGENCGRFSGCRTTPTNSTVPETCPTFREIGSTFLRGTQPRFTKIVLLFEIIHLSYQIIRFDKTVHTLCLLFETE